MDSAGPHAQADPMGRNRPHLTSALRGPGALLWLALLAGQPGVAADQDGDGIGDAADNCTLVSNPLQVDTNADGYGNICDADLDNTGAVNFTDLSLFKQRFGSSNPDANLNGLGVVDFADLAIFKSLFGKPPGPAGLVP